MILVSEFASLILQDDILLPLCPVATEEPSSSPCRQKRSHPRSRTHLAVAETTWCMSIFLESGTIVAWMAPKEVSARGSTQSAEGLRHPCSRSQTEVEVQLHRFSTVLDTHLAPGLTRKVCQTLLFHLSVVGRASIGSSTSSSICGPIGICNS